MGPLPFRFNPLWDERDGFGDLISQVWSQFIAGSPSFVWEQKLKLTKVALKRWIKIPIKNHSRNKEEFVQALVDI